MLTWSLGLLRLGRLGRQLFQYGLVRLPHVSLRDVGFVQDHDSGESLSEESVNRLFEGQLVGAYQEMRLQLRDRKYFLSTEQFYVGVQC